MDQLERQVHLQLASHARQDDLDLDGVADDHAEEVVRVAGLGDRRAGQVRLVADL